MRPLKHPAWLRAQLDQLLAHLADAMPPGPIAADIVMVMLSEPPEGSSQAEIERWERSCDNCGHWCAPGEDLMMGMSMEQLPNGIPVQVSFGACRQCAFQ